MNQWKRMLGVVDWMERLIVWNCCCWKFGGMVIEEGLENLREEVALTMQKRARR